MFIFFNNNIQHKFISQFVCCGMKIILVMFVKNVIGEVVIVLQHITDLSLWGYPYFQNEHVPISGKRAKLRPSDLLISTGSLITCGDVLQCYDLYRKPNWGMKFCS